MNFYYGDGGTRTAGNFYYKNPNCRNHPFEDDRRLREERGMRDEERRMRKQHHREDEEDRRMDDMRGMDEEAAELMGRSDQCRCEFCREVRRCLSNQHGCRPPCCPWCKRDDCWRWDESADCKRECERREFCRKVRCCLKQDEKRCPWHECRKPWPPHINCNCRCNTRPV